MKIVIASDHNGVAFKKLLKHYLESKKHQCTDIGSFGEESVDYPDYAIPAAEMVARGEVDRGILICGSGIGMAMAANKVIGVRAALCLNADAAKLSRQHNDANVLALTGWQCETDDIYAIVDNFLETDFEGGRHKRRVDKIIAYEKSIGRRTAKQ
jgi:ribose 5-phosphate isomerase B